MVFHDHCPNFTATAARTATTTPFQKPSLSQKFYRKADVKRFEITRTAPAGADKSKLDKIRVVRPNIAGIDRSQPRLDSCVPAHKAAPGFDDKSSVVGNLRTVNRANRILHDKRQIQRGIAFRQ